MAFSRLLPVRQHFPDRSIGDIPAAIARELASSEFGAKLKPGSRALWIKYLDQSPALSVMQLQRGFQR